MDYKHACELLNLKKGFTPPQLKKAYYKQALKFHPDKSPDTEEKFKEVGEAYAFLQKNKKIKIENLSYSEILSKFFNMDLLLFKHKKPIEIIFQPDFSLRIFEKLKKELAVQIFDLTHQYNEILGFSEETLKKMKEIIQKKMEKDRIIILNPTMDELLNDKVYKFQGETKTFFCPLWHKELCFDDSGNDVIIKCEPELDENIKITEENIIFIKIEASIQKVLEEEKITFNIGKSEFIISSNELHIVSHQTYVFNKKGILKKNSDNIFDTSNRSNIYVDIYLS